MTASRLLTDRNWPVSYCSEDGDPVKLFFEPALECAKRYDRTTGYFSAGVLSLAARGISALIRNGGKMRLVVGCTLNPPETAAMTEGYNLRDALEAKLLATDLTPETEEVRSDLGQLAWMIQEGFLDVKVAVPVDANEKPVLVEGIYHAKVGVIEDEGGNLLSFSGSINETAAGWSRNAEEFHIFGSWRSDLDHLEKNRKSFDDLWEKKVPAVCVYDFPEAVRRKLLEFLPKNATPISPPPLALIAEPAFQLTPEEFRRIVWTFTSRAAGMANGLRVGELTSAVTAWPHQIHTYTRFLNSWPARILIADEVGLGKTISAGLILRQAILSGKAKRVLIMVPAAVMVQWQNELYEKFNLSIPRYEDDKLIWRDTYGEPIPRERKVSRTEWMAEACVICSSHLMRRKDRAAELLKAEPWDLLILDEAHHARRESAGAKKEGAPNRLLSLMHELRHRCASLLLMTATPMQVHPVEVWDLLNLLGLPHEWRDGTSLTRYFELTARVPADEELEWLAELFRGTERALGAFTESTITSITPAASKLRRNKVMGALRDHAQNPLRRRALSAEERRVLCEVLQKTSPLGKLMIRNTRALLRRYVELGILTTPIATRKVETRSIEMSASERRVYQLVEDYISDTYNAAQPAKRSAIGFVMTTYRRRLASSFAALKATLTKRLQGVAAVTEEDVPQDETATEQLTLEDATAQAASVLAPAEKVEIHSLLAEVAKLNTDSKARQLVVDLKAIFDKGYDSAIVFTQYTDTLDYIKEHVARELPEERLATYQGTGSSWLDSSGMWKRVTKEEIKRRLRKGLIDILFCTDAANEGLNLQACGALVNYDLPWNPMKVEQRIGRIDRIGQKYPEVRIVNFGYKDSVEADVFFSVGSRINLFENIVGKLQPILSRLPRRIEQFTLSNPASKEEAQRRFIAELEAEIEEARDAVFDIDASSAESLDLPSFPAPPLTPEDLDRVLRNSKAVPPGVELHPKEPGSYGVALAGRQEEVRVTTRPDDFEYNTDNLQFFSPGGPIFDALQSVASTEARDDQGDGVCWLAGNEFVVRTTNGFRGVAALNELLDWARHPARPGPAPEATESGAILLA